MEQTKRIRSSTIVLLFGILINVMMVLHCLVPFIGYILTSYGYTNRFIQFINTEFSLPIEIMATFWVAVSSAYVGVDRAIFAAHAATTAYVESNKELDKGSSSRNLHVILQSLVLFLFAVLLNFVFNKDLALSQFFIALGSSITLYVAGTKSISVANELTNTERKEGCKNPPPPPPHYPRPPRGKRPHKHYEEECNSDLEAEKAKACV